MANFSKCKASKSLTAPTDRKICLRWAAVVFAAVASLLMAVACAPNKKKSKQEGSATFVTTLPKKIADQAYVKSSLVCQTPSGYCPEASALLVSKSPNAENTDLFQCSSFLVGNDIVATNTHCIPKELRLKGSQCSGRIQVVFGRTKDVLPATYDCDQVLFASEIIEDEVSPEYMQRPDYAFIKLKQIVVKRKPLKFSRLGLQEGLPLNILAIDPSPDTTQVLGTLKLKRCVAAQNSIAAQNFTHDFAPVGFAAGCKSMKGNSGSPALDSSGQVRGILYAGHDNADLKTSPGIQVPEKFESTTLFSNVACITVPDRVLAVGGISPACEEESGSSIFQTLLNRMPFKPEPLFENWRTKESPSMFSFSLTKTESPGALNNAFPTADCIQPLTRWTQVPAKNADGTLTLNYELPFWSQTQAINSKLQAQISIKQTSKLSVQTTIHAEALEKGEPTFVIEDVTSENGLVKRHRKAHLSVCR